MKADPTVSQALPVARRIRERPGNSRGMVEFTGMVHPLLATSEFHGAALTALIAVFDDVCRELNLNTDDDTAVVAEVVLKCAREGNADPAHVRKRVRDARATV